jgi:hypothetical protein
MFGIVLLREIDHHWCGATCASSPMPSRRLDDRIRHLSDQATDAAGDELDVILANLLAAIHEKMERLRSLAINSFLGGRHPAERRSTPP